MHSYWHSCQPCCNHTKQSCLRCHGMHHRGAFLTEHLYQTEQSYNILPWGDMSFHRDRDGSNSLPFSNGLHLLTWGRKSYYLILLTQLLQYTTTEDVKRFGNRCSTDDLHNRIKRFKMVLCCILNFKLLPKRRYPN